MELEVSRAPRPLRGRARVPNDKSISHRAVMLAALARGRSEIDGFLPGADCLATVRCLEQLGVQIERPAPERLLVTGRDMVLAEAADVLDVGNSGTTIRLLSGILAGQPHHSVLTGDASIRRRPMQRVTGPLRQMGARIDGRQDGSLAPLSIRGGALQPISYQSPVASAQVKSALLLAGLFCPGQTRVTEPARSRDHTERMLTAFGALLTTAALSVQITGPARLEAQRVQVPGDLSSAAFLLLAATLVPGSEVLIEGVGLNPTRTGILDIMAAMGADISVVQVREETGEPVGDLLVRAAALVGTRVDGELATRAIDELPLVAVAACFAKGVTVIADAAELRVKESDRISAVASELRRLGAEVTERPDGLVIEGPQPLVGARVESHHDHRLAMALYVAGLCSDGCTRVAGAEAMEVSFPGFVPLLQTLVER